MSTLLDRSWEQPTAKDWAEVLAGLPLFSRCRRRQLRKLAGLAQFREFAPGSMVIQAGEPSNAFYLILSGQARVLGKPRARLLRIGDYFGEMGLIDGEPRSASIVAGDELQVMRLPRRPFLRLVEHEPGIAMAMLGELSRRVRGLEKSNSA
jgi:CRP/FNR family cyclic AMP-dependent transcriptional regulator